MGFTRGPEFFPHRRALIRPRRRRGYLRRASPQPRPSRARDLEKEYGHPEGSTTTLGVITFTARHHASESPLRHPKPLYSTWLLAAPAALATPLFGSSSSLMCTCASGRPCLFGLGMQRSPSRVHLPGTPNTEAFPHHHHEGADRAAPSQPTLPRLRAVRHPY